MGVRFSLKTVLRDCVIMLCGTVLGILLAQGFFNTNNKVKIISHLTKREHLWPVDESTNHNNSQKSTDRPKKGPNDTSSLQQVYVGIVTQKLLSTTTVAAINDTWGRNVPKLEFLSTYNTLSVEGLSVVRLNGMEDTYSPEVKVYRMLKYIHDYHVNEYNWFMLVTDDVYIHVENLIQFLNKLDSSQMIYIGKSHKMITKDISKKDHCLRGPGVTVSRALLKKLIPFLEEYLEVSDKDAVTCNQVVERCISMKLGAQCTWIDETSQTFMNETDVSNTLDDYNNQRLQNITLLHLLNDPTMMYRIHQYYVEMEISNSMSRTKELFKDLQNVSRHTKNKRTF